MRMRMRSIQIQSSTSLKGNQNHHHHHPHQLNIPSSISNGNFTALSVTRRHFSICTVPISSLAATIFSILISSSSPAHSAVSEFYQLPDSGGVKALDLRIGSGAFPIYGDQVVIHYYGRLAAKQGWRFDSTYDHKDSSGEPTPFVFQLGSGKVISGIETAVKSMRVGGLRRVIIPPSQGYQSTSQEPLPPSFFDRQRLFTTIFNPTRLANGEGSTLGTLIFDIELVSLRHCFNNYLQIENATSTLSPASQTTNSPSSSASSAHFTSHFS